MFDHSERSFDMLRAHILEADDGQILEIIRCIETRYRSLHPGTEVLFLTVPRDDARERAAMARWLSAYLDPQSA
jgi:hypothetical protein